MKNGTLYALAFSVLSLATTGCSNTVRHMTAARWIETHPGGAPAAGAAQAAADDGRTFYLTYWEGSCSSGIAGLGRGCTLGDSRIKRCNVKSDNTMACVDEPEANRIFAREKH
ncbi:Hypothetical protein A7982_03706 [Minicystis rosea]|nr:Hypothetical protein A7982_03706 [Minicystis rosea]